MINIGQICESIENCKQCEKEFLRYSYCCLFECGEHVVVYLNVENMNFVGIVNAEFMEKN